MSAWAGIESSPAGAPARPPSNGGARPSRPAARPFRRQQRPVIGSIDAAGVMVQRHARELLVGSALIILPGVALNLLAATLAFDRYESVSGSVVSVPELLGGAAASTGVEAVFWYVGLLVNSLAACLVGGYAAALAAQRRLGQPLSIGSGYRALAGRAPALVAAWALGHSWMILIGILLRAVGGAGKAALIVFGSPLVLVAITMTVAVAPAIVIERTGPLAGLRRAWRLARISFGTLFGFTLASVAIGAVVQYGIAYLPRVAQATGLLTFGRFGWLIEGVAGQLGRLVSMPLVAVATALVYLETRMNAEGMDIVLDAERAFGHRR